MLVLFFTCFILFDCGKSSDEKTDDAITTALISLTKGNCQEAIDTLEAFGRKNGNADYLKTLASAYACRGNFNTTKLFADDIQLFGTPATIGGAARFSTSDDMIAPTSSQFADVQAAIQILLFAGDLLTSQNTSSALRATKFNATDASNIDAQLLYMLIVQLGRYIRFYGNGDSTGVKGAGGGSHQCLANYDNNAYGGGLVNTDTVLASSGGACTASTDPGSPDLGATGNLNVTRMCHGVIILNNIIDILPNFLNSFSGTQFSGFNSLTSTINTAKSTIASAVGTAADAVLAVTSQSKCEADNAADDTPLQHYFVFLYETLFQ